VEVFDVASDATSFVGKEAILDEVFKKPDEVARCEACLPYILAPDAGDDDAEPTFLVVIFSDKGGGYAYRVPVPLAIKLD